MQAAMSDEVVRKGEDSKTSIKAFWLLKLIKSDELKFKPQDKKRTIYNRLRYQSIIKNNAEVGKFFGSRG